MVVALMVTFFLVAVVAICVAGVLIYRVDNRQAIRNRQRSKALRVNRARRVAAFCQAWSLN